MDRPEILNRLFFPRREYGEGLDVPNAMTRFVEVAPNISIGCRLYPTEKNAPNIIYFHGNGEIAPEYDYIAPVYNKRRLNLLVTDYRGYGYSGGNPTCSNMIKDAHPIFQDFVYFLKEQGYTGSLFVMGRSLGSAPAIELAYHYQLKLAGLIVESGFSSASNQFARIGVTHLFRDSEKPIGFGNDVKIKEVYIPTLIIHGEEDEIIPVAEGKALYALSGAEEKLSLFIPHAGHNDLMTRGMEAYMAAIERFTHKGNKNY